MTDATTITLSGDMEGFEMREEEGGSISIYDLLTLAAASNIEDLYIDSLDEKDDHSGVTANIVNAVATGTMQQLATIASYMEKPSLKASKTRYLMLVDTVAKMLKDRAEDFAPYTGE